MARRIIIDTDPGQDDAIALLLALASPEHLDVLGITTVAGNVPLALTTPNALSMVEMAGRTDVAVYAGCDRPMKRELVTAEFVHGETGLDGAGVGSPTTAPASEHAVDFLVSTLANTEHVTLCPLGPLTNIATALEREPTIAKNIDQIVLMGGGHFEGGNITPAAEFNIYVDPEAADIVFRSGIALTMMPLDVTHKARTSPARIQAFRDLGNHAGASVAGMLSFAERFDIDRYGTEGGPLHDPTVIAWLLRPDIFDGRECNVAIETESRLTRGMTVVDWWRGTRRDPNCLVINDVDSDAFFALLVDRIRHLP